MHVLESVENISGEFHNLILLLPYPSWSVDMFTSGDKFVISFCSHVMYSVDPPWLQYFVLPCKLNVSAHVRGCNNRFVCVYVCYCARNYISGLCSQREAMQHFLSCFEVC